jgi:hypothetical protein
MPLPPGMDMTEFYWKQYDWRRQRMTNDWRRLGPNMTEETVSNGSNINGYKPQLFVGNRPHLHPYSVA